MKPQRILITGGAGFIGSHLVEQLIASGARVTVADNLLRKSYANILPFRKEINFINVDLTTLSGALKVTRNQDVVFNLAAVNTGIDYDIGRTQYMFEENMLLQMQPLRAAALNKVKKFIQISSASVYSRKAMETRAPTRETDDTEEPEPSKLGYALAKKMGEKMAVWYARNTTLHTVIARPTNVYGPRDHYDSMGHFIPEVIQKFLHADGAVEIFGSGNQKRSFLYVSDLVSALLLLMKKGGRGEIYNIDPQDDHSVKEIVGHIRKSMKLTDIAVHYNSSLPEGSKIRLLDNDKIKSLGWMPKHSVMHEIPELIADIRTRYAKEKT